MDPRADWARQVAAAHSADRKSPHDVDPKECVLRNPRITHLPDASLTLNTYSHGLSALQADAAAKMDAILTR